MADYDVELVPFSEVVWSVTPDDADVSLIAPSTFLFATTPDDADVEILTTGDLLYTSSPEPPSGGGPQTVVNRVWDSVEGDFVRWTTDVIDAAGTEYPGPGTYELHTSHYVVENIEFGLSFFLPEE